MKNTLKDLSQMTTRTQLADRLRMIRELRGTSVQELADAVGCQRSTIHRIESGKYWPSLPQLMKMVEVLDYEVEIMPSASDETSVVTSD